MTYVISDIHGCYDQLMQLLAIIEFNEEDELFVVGDCLDRGPDSCKVLVELMKHPSVVCLAGNHEVMALTCLRFLRKEIMEDTIDQIDERMLEEILCWQENGGTTTMEEFSRLDEETQKDLIDYMEGFSLYEEVTVNGQDYLLVHAGLGNFSPERPIDDYELDELIWERADYSQKYFEDIILVTGHTPTQTIPENDAPGKVYRKNNHLAIDCGAAYGGRLGMVCLDTMEVYYADSKYFVT